MRPVAITSTPFSGTMPSRADGRLPDDAGDLGALVLQREVDVAGGVALQFGDLAAHPHAAEIALQRALHRAGDLRDGVFGDVGYARGGQVVHAKRVGDRATSGHRGPHCGLGLEPYQAVMSGIHVFAKASTARRSLAMTVNRDSPRRPPPARLCGRRSSRSRRVPRLCAGPTSAQGGAACRACRTAAG